ncbi:receptor homology region, transmembrane domain- and RING domain-containing protein 1 isoform X1 [Physcomitrium patens]|uniref:RING-type E3 ubiquitin transferase n=1 Tax=Physcomitrium patens TaxID=3218 RepID=A0A7I4BWY2_PHYPA|nr:receptor homology region, transmembrane domain- and RING domain-containing protein 1-like [Physcomitrium patens]|eukprot:XP_024384113.1 receptor homology region, transmembrane domain- and RING domain-containing protein 1-like [Physcomitrella patens]
MPSVVAEAGFASRIMSYREIMISLAGLCLVLLTLLIGRVNSAVILLAGTNETWSFPDVESRFAPRVPTAGVGGVLYASNPLDACSPLLNVSTPGKGSAPAFLLVQRGVCNFEIKVRLAQEAGFAAVIVYNDQDDRELVTMSGNPVNIHAYAVFVSKYSGEFLLKYAGDVGATCHIMPAFENTAWSVMAVSFISLLAVSSVLATFFFVRQHRLRHLSARYLLREPAGMSVKEVNALPSLIFKCVEDGKCTSETCVVCLEDYIPGERLRLLPCQHEFHLDCIDQWLTLRKPFCPVCKRDAQSQVHEPVATETTPLMAAVGRALGGGSIRVGTSILSARSSPLFTTSVINSPNDTPDTRIFSLSYPDGGEDLC